METVVPKSLGLTNFSQISHQPTFPSSSIVSMYHAFFGCPIKLTNCAHHFFLGQLKVVAQECFASITYRCIKIRLLCTVSYCFSRVRSYTLLSRSNICQFCDLILFNNSTTAIKFYLNQLILSRFRPLTKA